MRILIEYDSCWQTRFLDGDPNKSVDKNNPRKFIATSSTNGESPAPITKSTVMGVLCRLIGDQRKLFKAKESDSYYFADIESKISFGIERPQEGECDELVYLTNKSDDRCGQSNFLGVLSDDNPWFFSKNSPLIWSTLFLNKSELLSFILNEKMISKLDIDCSPKTLMARISLITDSKSEVGEVWKLKEKLISDKINEFEKMKAKLMDQLNKIQKQPDQTQKQMDDMNKLRVKHHEICNQESVDLLSLKADKEINELDTLFCRVIALLKEKYPDCDYVKDGVIYPYRFYSAALYLQSERLLNQGFDISFVKNKKGEVQIQGFSKRGFNGVRDWLGRMTGNRKKAVGTPCVIQKQSGQLEITIDVEKEKALEIETLIENAGVSAFYLGKKGLAYVSKIRV